MTEDQRRAPLTSSDTLTYVIAYLSELEGALRGGCGIGLTQYRILCHLEANGGKSRPADVARGIAVSPALITSEARKLGDALLVDREPGAARRNPADIAITKLGIKAVHIADSALQIAHSAFFAPIPPKLLRTLESGALMVNPNPCRIRRSGGDAFFYALETMESFLVCKSFCEKFTQRAGMPYPDFRVLFYLDERGAPQKPSQIAERLLLSRPSISISLGRLREAGFVETTPCRGDRRSSLVSVSESGSTFARSLVADLDASFLGIRPAPSGPELAAYQALASAVVESRCPS